MILEKGRVLGVVATQKIRRRRRRRCRHLFQLNSLNMENQNRIVSAYSLHHSEKMI